MPETTNFENAYALIIGLSHYQDQRISTLNYTRADAESFYEIITDPKKIGIKKENVKILMDSDATLPNIKGAIVDWLIKKSNDNSTVYIFFAGHGGVEVDHLKREKDGLAKYLLSYDSNFDSLYSSALSSRDFNELLSTLQYKKLIAFIDACHSGGTCGAARDIKITEDPYQELSEGEGRVIIAASKPDQRSYEDANLGHGVFTHHLMEALSGKADTDNDGLVSVFDVYKYLRDKVPKSAKELANATQEPVLKGENIAKDFTISINPERIEEIDEEKKREEAARKLRLFHVDGELSGKQYGRLRKIVKTDFEKLGENEKVVAKLIDDLISAHINVTAFLEDLEDIEPELFEIAEKEKKEQERLRRGEEEQRKKKEAEILQKEKDKQERQRRDEEELEQARALEGISKIEKILKEKNVKKFCPGCGQQNIHESEFCTNCGSTLIEIDGPTIEKEQVPTIEKEQEPTIRSKVKIFCPICGRKNERELEHCSQCGTKLSLSNQRGGLNEMS